MGTVIYVRYPGDEMLLKWHTDAGPALRDFRVEPDSRPLNFKVQHFLTDIPAHNRANFCLVPGSHRQNFPEDGLTPKKWPEGGIQLIVEAGRRRHLSAQSLARHRPAQGPGDPS